MRIRNPTARRRSRARQRDTRSKQRHDTGVVENGKTQEVEGITEAELKKPGKKDAKY